jgi:hypothetical protein
MVLAAYTPPLHKINRFDKNVLFGRTGSQYFSWKRNASGELSFSTAEIFEQLFTFS